jgi:hypothetical protein
MLRLKKSPDWRGSGSKTERNALQKMTLQDCAGRGLKDARRASYCCTGKALGVDAGAAVKSAASRQVTEVQELKDPVHPVW